MDALIDHLDTFRETGVEILFVEMVPRSKQHLIDRLPHTGGELEEFLGEHWNWGYEGPFPHPYLELVQTAKERGLKVVGIDIDPEDNPRGGRYIIDRIRRVNRKWVGVINEYIENNDELYLIFAGNSHCDGFFRGSGWGLDSLLGIGHIKFNSRRYCYQTFSGKYH